MIISKLFTAHLNNLHEMLDFVSDYCTKQGFNNTAVNLIVLATEEALVNIIKYAYEEREGTVEIICEECDQKPGIKIIIKDEGIPFNPIFNKNGSKRFHKLNLEESQEGGYGIFLFSEIMDLIEYKWDKGRNFLSLVKYH